jgi:biopolymer transport protein ExbD
MTEDISIAMQPKKAGVRKMKRHSVRVDMTPMVDLGFLLITFFVMTAEMQKPRVTNLIMPKDQKDGPVSTLGMSNALTVLIKSETSVYYYHGAWEDAQRAGQVHSTNFSITDGIGKIIREKQIALDKSKPNGRKELMLLIKAGNEATYQQVIDALDEPLINDVKKYALVKMEKEEAEYLQKLQ